jgi:hemolysin-activating ACP:hemolysin acyltransferase
MALFAQWSPAALATLFASGSTAMSLLKFSKIVQDLQRVKAIELGNVSDLELDEDITALRLSLAPQALTFVRTGKIDFNWLYRPANAGCIVGDCVQDLSNVPPQAWVKWRSLGVFALATLRQGDADVSPEAFLAKYLQSAETSAELPLSPATPWVHPLRFDALTALGVTIGQLATSPYHRQFKLSYYLPVEILPPLKASQLRCFLDAEGTPLGLTTWAWLSDDLRHDIHETGRALQPDEWTGGSHPFVNDWITEPRAFRAVMAEKRDVIFPDHIVSSLRRHPDGSVRRVNKWVGRNRLRATTATSES